MMKLFVELSIKYDEDTIFPEAVQGLVIDLDNKALVDIAVAPTIAEVFKLIEKTWVLNFVRRPDNGEFETSGERTLLQIAEDLFPDLDRKVREKELPPLIGDEYPEKDTEDKRTRTQKIE